MEINKIKLIALVSAMGINAIASIHELFITHNLVLGNIYVIITLLFGSLIKLDSKK